MPPWPLVYAVDGVYAVDSRERARRRRRTNHAPTPTIKAPPTKPPTTLPAIAPAFELLCEVEVEAEAADELGVKVDWETLIVDGGTIVVVEVVPVTSGLSG